MNQRIPHTELTSNKHAAAYGYKYDGFAQAPIQYKVSFDGNYDDIKDGLWTMMQRGFTCSGIDANNVWIDENFPIIDDNMTLDNVENDQYFYHTDHLGSSSWITNNVGDVNQHLQYLPFGESFIDQRTNHDIRFKFTTKEEDSETGYQYFGARYYSSDLSIWLSVDPLAARYPYTSSYMYVLGNPVRYTDPDGRWVKGAGFFNNIFKNDQQNKAEIYAKNMRKQGYSTTIIKNGSRDYDVAFSKKGEDTGMGVANFSKGKGNSSSSTGSSGNTSGGQSSNRSFINSILNFFGFQVNGKSDGSESVASPGNPKVIIELTDIEDWDKPDQYEVELDFLKKPRNKTEPFPRKKDLNNNSTVPSSIKESKYVYVFRYNPKPYDFNYDWTEEKITDPNSKDSLLQLNELLEDSNNLIIDIYKTKRIFFQR